MIGVDVVAGMSLGVEDSENRNPKKLTPMLEF